MLVISCMRSASSSMCKALREYLNLKKAFLQKRHRDWENNEGIPGYMHYPSSTAIYMSPDLIKSWVTDRTVLCQEHLIPVQEHREALMSIDKEQRKVVIMKRNAEDSFRSQMNRNTACAYLSRGKNSEKCLQEFEKFREEVEIMYPEKDGFLHIEFEDLISDPDKEIRRVFEYWGFPYDKELKYEIPHLK